MIIFIVPLYADETIIQEEKISYMKCLSVIDISEGQLSIAPEISQVSDQIRVAVFGLSDGVLIITCDGSQGTIKVTTKVN